MRSIMLCGGIVAFLDRERQARVLRRRTFHEQPPGGKVVWSFPFQMRAAVGAAA
jgi:hypothetical protein